MTPKRKVEEDDIIRPAPDIVPVPQGHIRPTLATDDYSSPCFVTGIIAGASGGLLGSVFGFVTQLVKHQGPGRLGGALKEGVNSAKAFAVLGGVYSGALCYARRLRGSEDAVNSAVAGCATGLVLGWKAGVGAAAQSCAGLGFFSYIFDRFIAPESAHAAARSLCAELTDAPVAMGAKGARGPSAEQVKLARVALVASMAVGPLGGSGELGTLEGLLEGVSALRAIQTVYDGPTI